MAGAVGPFVGGVMFDYYGNYQLFLWLLVATAAMAGVLFAMAPPPVRETSPSAEREYLSWPVTRVASG